MVTVTRHGISVVSVPYTAGGMDTDVQVVTTQSVECISAAFEIPKGTEAGTWGTHVDHPMALRDFQSSVI